MFRRQFDVENQDHSSHRCVAWLGMEVQECGLTELRCFVGAPRDEPNHVMLVRRSRLGV